MLTIWIFNTIEIKDSLYHGENCIKKFCSSLKEHSTNIISFERKKVLPLTEKELKLPQDATTYYIVEKYS